MDKAEGKKIVITRDGPYELHGDIDVNIASIGTNAEGDSVSWVRGHACERTEPPLGDTKETVTLCRCGHSRTKPFCDGTHDDVGFCGHEKAGRKPYEEAAEVQEGRAVNLMDDPSLCVGARFCDVGASVWRYAQSGEPDSVAMAIEESCKCPSGRLTVVSREGEVFEPELEAGIGVVQDPANNCRGPLWVQGGIPIEGSEGEKYEVRNRVTLCRCGMSANQPYCDGSHYNSEHMQGLDK